MSVDVAIADNLTEAASLALRLATQAALADGGGAPRGEHLVSVLPGIRSCVVSRLLLHLGFSEATLRRALDRSPAPRRTRGRDGAELEAILRHARIRSAQVGSPVVSTGHLLVGVMRGAPRVAQALATIGLTADLVDDHLDPPGDAAVWE